MALCNLAVLPVLGVVREGPDNRFAALPDLDRRHPNYITYP
jgi:hypothetical protein